MRILKILGIIIAVAVIGVMAIGMLGIGMIMVYDHVDSYTLGRLTRPLLTYGAIAFGAVVVIVKLVKSMRGNTQSAPTKESSV
jgi:hypothetical protein